LHQGKPALAGSLIPLKRNKKMKQKNKRDICSIITSLHKGGQNA